MIFFKKNAAPLDLAMCNKRHGFLLGQKACIKLVPEDPGRDDCVFQLAGRKLKVSTEQRDGRS